MSKLTYFQSIKENSIPQQLSVVPFVPIQDNPNPPPSNTYSGTLSNFSTIPAPYPATSYIQSNIAIKNNPYPPQPNTYSGALPNFTTVPAPYPAPSYIQSNIAIKNNPYPPHLIHIQGLYLILLLFLHHILLLHIFKAILIPIILKVRK